MGQARFKERAAPSKPEGFDDYVPTYSPLAVIAPVRRGAGGRPSKYDERYCDDVVDFMSQGFSLSAYADYVQVDRVTLQEWQTVHQEFSRAVSRAKSARLRYWETRGLEVARTGGNGSQATMIIFGLKNMGSDEWREKLEVTGTVTLASLVEQSMRLVEGQTIDEPKQDQALSDDSSDLFG